jgi:hypothetical protein
MIFVPRTKFCPVGHHTNNTTHISHLPARRENTLNKEFGAHHHHLTIPFHEASVIYKTKLPQALYSNTMVNI